MAREAPKAASSVPSIVKDLVYQFDRPLDFLRAAGIPCYGIHPLAVTEADARRAHASDERVRLASVRQGLEFFHALLGELTQAR